MKTLRIRLPDLLAEQVRVLASRRRMTKSEVVREALATHFAFSGSSPRSSFAALAVDLIGCTEGPEDLATNTNYLADYGR